jgi:hypothetical protein
MGNTAGKDWLLMRFPACDKRQFRPESPLLTLIQPCFAGDSPAFCRSGWKIGRNPNMLRGSIEFDKDA